MSNRTHDYNSSYGGNGTAASSLHSDRDSPRLPSDEPFAGIASMHDDRVSYHYSKQGIGGAVSFSTAAANPSMYGVSAFDNSLVAGTKRSMEALYRQTVLGSHNSIGQTEALFSSNSLIKCPRLETGSNLPIYPQRPGARDCAYYMMTRTCKFGDDCMFDHPLWVPEGGIPDWKEIPLIPTSECLPERPGEPDCPYYMKTQQCKFGVRCKFNHPKEKLSAPTGKLGEVPPETTDSAGLPERPFEPVCSFYIKTGSCKFGTNCKFHHPKGLVPSSEQYNVKNGQQDSSVEDGLKKIYIPYTHALSHNSKGLPIRPGQIDCAFYLKTGSCKYGSTCCYNHVDRNTANYITGAVNPAANFLQNIYLQSAQASLGCIPAIYPQRPGEIECDFYMKTGLCKFGERCKFHHPTDRSTSTLDVKQASQQTVNLALAGLPRREGAVSCSFYIKTGTCKFGATCRFDHPPLGEAIAMVSKGEQKNAAAS
ncbi:zinc finger CCCH domain-containing protein 37 isoform X2 [Canna indica]|uniref:Zinc finger CCCH domain-containing protein 37 isoform X2 n=1 Tax=Canna indica TaxID=4628 RepID=A0AAQ3K044_9LILI|nr:zinc finger CCCH domain-containing protein 37 isoform X2 [Canna indica]